MPPRARTPRHAPAPGGGECTESGADEPQAPARSRPRQGRPRPPGEAAPLRQGQDRRRVAQAGLGRLRLNGRAHPLRREEARNPPRAPATRRPPPQPPPQAPLRRPQAQRLPACPPRRPRPSRHARRPPAPRRGPQAFHGAGRRLTLRCLAGGDAGDLRECRAIPRRHHCAHAVPGQGYPSGRRLRVPRGVRGGLQGARRLAVRSPAAFAEVERLRGARPPDACRGVLQLLRRRVGDGAVEPGAAGVGGVLQRGAPASVAWLADSDGVSCAATLGEGLLLLASSAATGVDKPSCGVYDCEHAFFHNAKEGTL